MFDAIDLLYDSVLDDGQWLIAVRALCDVLGARGTIYFAADREQGVLPQNEPTGIDARVDELYVAHYARTDPRVPPGLRVPVGEVHTGEMLVDPREFRKTAVYAELLTPYDIPRFLGFWVAKGPVRQSGFAFFRSARTGPFDRYECDRYSAVAPHVMRALRLRELLRKLRAERRIHLSVLDGLPFGTLLLDSAGGVLDASASAHGLFDANQALSIDDGRVHARHPDDDRAFQRVLQATVAPSKRRQVPGGSVALRRMASSVPIRVTVFPVRVPDVFPGGPPPAAIVLIDDPSAAPASPAAALKVVLGLTDAEAALATLVFMGLSLREASDRLGVSINTCKSQLKAIYTKTGCRTHVELMKAVLFAAGVTALPRQRD